MAGHTSTLRTLFGFLDAFLRRRLTFLARSNRLDDIYNYLPIEGLYTTSGQPSEAQFPLIKAAGFDTVVNLAPTSVLENSVIDEANILSGLGMKYVHIPVDFKNPTDADFNSFVETLRDPENENVWVHCAANMRVSSFTYRYRREVLDQEEVSAKTDLHKIWQPVGVWKDFINR